MTGPYNLQIAELDLTAAEAALVVAHFDNGAWFNCRVIVDPAIAQVTSCYDASQPYLKGFSALLTGESIDDCKPCTVRVSDDERAWLRARGEAWGRDPALPLSLKRAATY